MHGKAEHRWLGTSPCDNERAIALRKSALRAYERKSSELILPGPRSRIGTNVLDSRVQNRERVYDESSRYVLERVYRQALLLFNI